ncbi:hypothetical protein BpHYR1_028605 [Brachionus plicatilis]|uniref:Uncharacterized protein n=1 Tax=Brachionus plicatilis TaxID=10195 RepID=A0A3M7QR67_BRAPC|nr:hypothetical protein BpHYR1_028605 [Brachionus plicatilis]
MQRQNGTHFFRLRFKLALFEKCTLLVNELKLEITGVEKKMTQKSQKSQLSLKISKNWYPYA